MSEWISVEAELPEQYAEVLVCLNLDRPPRRVVSVASLQSDTPYWHDLQSDGYGDPLEWWGEVTHWMPLPEPPK